MKDVDTAAADVEESLAKNLERFEAVHQSVVAHILDPTKEPHWGDLAPRAVLLADEFCEIVRALAASVLSASETRLVNEWRLNGSQTRRESKWVTAQLQALSSITKQLSAQARDSSRIFEEMTLQLGQTIGATIEEKALVRTQLLAKAEASVLEFRSQTNRLVDELLFLRSELRQFVAKNNSRREH